jgi:hypothetical protein
MMVQSAMLLNLNEHCSISHFRDFLGEHNNTSEWGVPLGTPFLFSAYLSSFRLFLGAAESPCYFE